MASREDKISIMVTAEKPAHSRKRRRPSALSFQQGPGPPRVCGDPPRTPGASAVLMRGGSESFPRMPKDQQGLPRRAVLRKKCVCGITELEHSRVFGEDTRFSSSAGPQAPLKPRQLLTGRDVSGHISSQGEATGTRERTQTWPVPGQLGDFGQGTKLLASPGKWEGAHRYFLRSLTSCVQFH